MRIYPVAIKVKDIHKGFVDNGEEGVYALNGRLCCRPKYQREYIFNSKQQEAVIQSILNGFPLNTMYWSKTSNGENEQDDGSHIVDGDDEFEIMDGEQRTLSVMYFMDRGFPVEVDGRSYYYSSLPTDMRDTVDNYELNIYICEGTPSEKLAWFKVINTACVQLTEQELRNASYTGPWLTDAKTHFSKTNCVAYQLANRYCSKNTIRQELLETALVWICDAKGIDDVSEYMSLHQEDEDANELWQYFQEVISWVKRIFEDYYSDMKSVPWGILYNKYHKNTYNTAKISARVRELRADSEVQSLKGIYEFVLCEDKDPFAERLLGLRKFDERDKRKKYDEQGGICPICHGHFEYEEMEGDHIVPWSRGGKTEYGNLQMLCKSCNKHKSDD